MFGFLYFIVFLSLRHQVLVMANDITTMQFIIDFLRFQAEASPPTYVNTFLCWEISEVHYFAKYMSDQHFLVSAHTSVNSYLNHVKTTEDRNHEMFILDANCSEAHFVLMEANAEHKFRPWLKWLLLEDTLAEDLTDVILTDISMLLDSEVTVGRRTDDTTYECLEVYRRGIWEPLIKNVTCIWEAQRGITPTASLITSRRRINVHKSLLKAVMVVTDNDTLNHLDNTINKHIDTITKVNDALFHHIVDILNASIEMVIVDTWGYPDESGNWSGLAGYLQRNDADIGTTGMFVTKQRLPFVRYIASTSETKNSFIFRQPPLSFVENIFTLPFNRSTWWVSAAIVTLTGFILYVAFRWEIHKKELAGQRAEEAERVTGSDVILMSLGAVCQQGTTVEAYSIPGRILTFLLFTCVIFLYTAYSACIVALLQSSTNRIRTLQDLLNSGLTLGVEDVVYNRHYFPAATDAIRRAIYMKKVSPSGGPEHFMSLEEGLKKVRKGLFAFHVELGPGYEVISDTFLEEEKCGLETINFLIEIVEPWVGVSKTTPFTEILSVAYRMVRERGLQHRENVRFYQKKPECVSRGSLFVSVGIRDCYPALLVLVYGILFSIISLILEIMLHKWEHKKKKTQETIIN